VIKTSSQSRFSLANVAARCGAAMPLIAVFLVILITMAAFSIDLAYIELVKTELKAGTDAAAKAGTSTLMQGGSDAEAKAAAISFAAKNLVGGKSLAITASDITLGQTAQQVDGTWAFVPGAKPSQAVQVMSSLSSSNANGSVNLFFAPMLGQSTYSTSTTSVASAFAADVCLVLDRSQSMCFDLSGTVWMYPPPILTDWVTGIKNAPQPGSRWRALDDAVKSFTDILNAANAPPQVAVVTWADQIGTNTEEFLLTGQTSPAVTVELDLSTNMGKVYGVVHKHSSNVILGGTNMSAGMDQGTTILTSSSARPYAKKIMILMTDGQWNAGRNPIAAATDAVNQGITIHCVCFLKNADQTTTQQIASMTGGQFHYAANAAELTAAFQKLAYSLPVVLTK